MSSIHTLEMKINDLPLHKKPREKLLLKGINGLSDAELLAVLLRSGYRGKSAVEVAERLLQQWTLSEICTLPLPKLAKLKGIGLSRASAISAAKGIAERLGNDQSLLAINTPQEVVKLTQFLRHKKQEYLVVLYLGARHQLLAQETITIGTLNCSLIHGREVFAPALVHRAAFIILVHNHPSGDPQPSADDLEVTEKLLSIGELLDIPVVDHVIVAHDNWCSLKQQKLL